MLTIDLISRSFHKGYVDNIRYICVRWKTRLIALKHINFFSILTSIFNIRSDFQFSLFLFPQWHPIPKYEQCNIVCRSIISMHVLYQHESIHIQKFYISLASSLKRIHVLHVGRNFDEFIIGFLLGFSEFSRCEVNQNSLQQFEDLELKKLICHN